MISGSVELRIMSHRSEHALASGTVVVAVSGGGDIGGGGDSEGSGNTFVGGGS